MNVEAPEGLGSRGELRFKKLRVASGCQAGWALGNDSCIKYALLAPRWASGCQRGWAIAEDYVLSGSALHQGVRVDGHSALIHV